MDGGTAAARRLPTETGEGSCCGLPGWALDPLTDEGLASPLCALEGGGPGEESARAVDRVVRIPLVRDRRLYLAGTVGEFVYVVKAGIVKHAMTADDGKEAVVRLVTAGGVSGLEAIAGTPYRHSAVVLHPGSACRVPVAIIRKYEQLDPHAARELCRAWQQAVDDGDRLLRMSHGPALLRVARLLQLVLDTVGSGEAVCVRRADIGALFGLTEVSVARALSELRRRGLIRRRGNTLSHIDPRIAALVAEPERDRIERAPAHGAPRRPAGHEYQLICNVVPSPESR